MRGRRGRPQPGSYRGQGLRIHFQPNTTQFRFVHCFVCSPPAIPAGPPRTDCKDPFEDSGGGEIPPPKVQFKLYQGEVLQYNPGASDHRCGRMDLALGQIEDSGWGGFVPGTGGSTQAETPESAFQSECFLLDRRKMMSMKAVARMAVPMALCGCAAAFAPAGWGLRLKGAVPRALAPVPRSPRRSEQKRVLMQLSNLGGNTDKAAETSVDDFKKDGKSLTLLEKEQLYLECCASWNVEQKALLTDDEFETLKEDLEFEGSQVILMMS